MDILLSESLARPFIPPKCCLSLIICWSKHSWYWPFHKHYPRESFVWLESKLVIIKWTLHLVSAGACFKEDTSYWEPLELDHSVQLEKEHRLHPKKKCSLKCLYLYVCIYINVCDTPQCWTDYDEIWLGNSSDGITSCDGKWLSWEKLSHTKLNKYFAFGLKNVSHRYWSMVFGNLVLY